MRGAESAIRLDSLSNLAGSEWAARLGSLLAGALPVLAFPEPGLWVLAYAALVPLILMVRAAPDSRAAALRGWLGGTGLLLATHHWLTPKAGPLLLLAAAAIGLLWAPWGVAVRALLGGALSPGKAAAAAGLLPAGWVLIEVARSWESLGGPFGLLGATQWNAPRMLSLAAAGGVWAVGYVVVAVNVCIAVAWSSSNRVRAGAMVAGMSLLVLGPAYDALRTPPTPTGSAEVGVVQVGVTSNPEERFDAGIAHSRALDGVDVVLWGESSVGFELGERPGSLTRLRDLSREVDAPVLVNVDARRGTDDGIFKSSVLVSTEGIVDRYDKTRLVPFGEYIPLRPLFGWLTSVTDAAAEDRGRGENLRTMTVDGLSFVPLICFESAFPDIGRSAAAQGAEMIVYQSATTTFQDSWAPEIHASLAAVRAVETGRPVIHTTLTGTSAAFNAQGRELAWIPTDERGAYAIDVPLARGTTPFVRFGPWVPLVSLLAVGAAIARRLFGARTLRARR